MEEENEIIEMCKEIIDSNGIMPFEGTGNLKMVLDKGYKEWLEQNKIDKNTENIKPDWSNATNYILIDEFGHVYGCCSLRHHLKGNLINIGGNIGYGIRPSERRKGYGTIQLQLVLKEAKKLGLSKVLVTCRDNNIASKKTIEKCGGIKDDSVPSTIPEIMELRYWIDLCKEDLK